MQRYVVDAGKKEDGEREMVWVSTWVIVIVQLCGMWLILKLNGEKLRRLFHRNKPQKRGPQQPQRSRKELPKDRREPQKQQKEPPSSRSRAGSFQEDSGYTVSCAYCGRTWRLQGSANDYKITLPGSADPYTSKKIVCPNPACGRTHHGLQFPSSPYL